MQVDTVGLLAWEFMATFSESEILSFAPLLLWGQFWHGSSSYYFIDRSYFQLFRPPKSAISVRFIVCAKFPAHAVNPINLSPWMELNQNPRIKAHFSLSGSAQEQQILKIISREILNLSLNANFCISKNMAPFLYVFRTGPCFKKCKFEHSETD